MKDKEIKNLVLVEPRESDMEDWLRCVDEFHEDDPNYKPLDFCFGQKFEDWFKKIEDERKGVNLQKGRVRASVYFLKYVGDDRILGHCSIRHSIDDEFLRKVGGHIGYGVRPSERGKGLATQMLKLAMAECAKLGITNAMISCKKTNLASAKVIGANGGVKRDEVDVNGEVFNRYDLKIRK